MGIGLTMLSLTKAQKAFVEKAKAGVVHPYGGGEWSVFYRLKAAGVMRYVADTGAQVVELTPEAKGHMK